MSAPAPRSDERIARARLLAERHPDAAEILVFYAALCEFQRSLPAEPLAGAIDREQVTAAIPRLLAWLERHGPEATAQAARRLRDVPTDEWRHRIDARPADGADAPDDETAAFVVEVVRQPFAEQASRAGWSEGRAERMTDPGGAARCPACRGLPLVAVLREEGHGARRSLVCADCLIEWPSHRLLCAACGEREFAALPVFTAEQFGHIRVEACDTCRRYLKAIDLTKDGLAVPVVDDIASVALDLWAREQGYARVRLNILRT